MTESSISYDESSAPSLAHDPKRLGRAVFGAVFLVIFLGYFLEARSMDSGTLHRPGAGMYPFWIGVSGITVSIIVVAEAFLTRTDSGKIDYPNGADLRNTVIFVAMLLVFILVLPYIGMYAAATVFAVLFLRVIGALPWLRSTIVGVGMGVGLTFCFNELLSLPLPSGSLLP